MSPADGTDRDDEDLRVLLADLETTLSALREDLSEAEGNGADDGPRTESRSGKQSGGLRPDPRPDRPGRTPPQPPSLTELFRFTEQYTLPTVISLLEATIQSLELLRGVLRVADPDRSAFDRRNPDRRPSGRSRLGDDVARVGRDAVSGVGREAVSGVERALAELQTALSASDVPAEGTSRELLEDARRLSGEVADRLDESRRAAEADRYGYRRADREGTRAAPEGGSDAVTIGVTDVATDTTEPRDGGRDARKDEEKAAGERGARPDGADEGRERDEDRSEPTQIDVEAELASIKDQVEPRGKTDDADTGGESNDADGDPASGGGGSATDGNDDGPRNEGGSQNESGSENDDEPRDSDDSQNGGEAADAGEPDDGGA